MGTDMLNYAIGACLMQKHNKKIHAIIYYSRKILSIELNYNIHDKELLAIVSALDY